MSKFKVLGKLFSKTDEALDALKRERGTGAEFLKELEKTPGVKAQEIKDRKLDKVLPAMGKTTKAEVKKVLEQNPPPKLQEEVLGKVDTSDLDAYPQPDDSWNIRRISDRSFVTNVRGYTDDPEGAIAEAASRFSDGASKYGQYQIPGGENYREILLKLPKTEPKLPPLENFRVVYDPGQGWVVQSNKRVVGPFAGESEAMDKMYQLAREARWRTREELEALRRESRGFESPHWDQPNVLAHARVSDRVGPNGEKILHIEEIQSDWHQKGRKEGYKSGDEAQQISALVKDYDALTARRRELLKQAEEMPGSGPEFVAAINEANDITPQLMRLQTQMDNLRSMEQRGVPDAPFKKNWHELTMKRLLNYAAENGYDRLAITPGAKQAERYKLSNVIDEINVVGRTHAGTGEQTRQVALDTKDGRSLRFGIDANGIVDNVSDSTVSNFMGKSLDEIVGKDVANKIMSGGTQTISGEGLEVGGEGMKGFYDKILPDYLNNYGKQYGAQVGAYDLDGIPLHSFDITPQMRQDITQKGLPLYQQIGIPTGIGATQLPEQEEPRRVNFSDNPDTMMLELLKAQDGYPISN